MVNPDGLIRDLELPLGSVRKPIGNGRVAPPEIHPLQIRFVKGLNQLWGSHGRP